MKVKFILFSFSFLLLTGIGFAQNKNEAQSIITGKVSIAKYHDRDELEKMPKGELLVLYNERIDKSSIL